jgi:hypothetical protein
MSDQSNPYSAPEAPLTAGTPEGPDAAAGGVTPKTRILVAKAGPWATFLGVIGFIGSGFVVLAAVAMVLMSGAANSGLGAAFSFLKPFGGAVGGIMGLLYLIIAAFIFFPSLFMVNIGSAAKKYRTRGEPADLERFVAGFKKWVKFYGIGLIVTLSLYAVAIVVALIAVVVRSAS